MSRRDDSIGALVMRNIVAAGFVGELYPIHPKADLIQGVPALRRISEAPGAR